MDEWLRGLLLKKIRLGKYRVDFLEALLSVLVTAVGYLLRTPFEAGLPDWPYLLAEWYLAVSSAVLVWRYTKNRKRALITYAVLLLLPTAVADGTVLGGNACIGALLAVCALSFLEQKKKWLFTAIMALLLAWSVKYAGILFAAMVLWQAEKIRTEQLLALLAAGAARFLYTYSIWLHAGYTLAVFHWPNIYEVVGNKTVQGQPVDPVAMVGLFLTLGLMAVTVYLFSFGKLNVDKDRRKLLPCGAGILTGSATLFRLFLFFGLAAGYFLPYMDQSYGYLYCVLGVLYAMLVPGEFFVPVLLQIVAYAGYQECLNGESMMPMAVFSVLQLLVLAWLGIQLLQEAGVYTLCRQKN